MIPKLLIRQDIFEFGVFPTPNKLTLINLVQLFSNLNLLSNIENKITLEQFKEQACQYIPNFQKSDAEVFFLSYKLLTEEDSTFLIEAVNK